jgi:hypothetical protein
MTSGWPLELIVRAEAWRTNIRVMNERIADHGRAGGDVYLLTVDLSCLEGRLWTRLSCVTYALMSCQRTLDVSGIAICRSL